MPTFTFTVTRCVYTLQKLCKRGSLTSRDVSSKFSTSRTDSGLASTHQEISINDRVYVMIVTKRYGVVRYIGPHPRNSEKRIVGIEMDIPDPKCYTDGTFNKEKYFDCKPKSALFVDLVKVKHDDRSLEG